jgi:hypothetical protein
MVMIYMVMATRSVRVAHPRPHSIRAVVHPGRNSPVAGGGSSLIPKASAPVAWSRKAALQPKLTMQLFGGSALKEIIYTPMAAKIDRTVFLENES